MSWLCGQGCSCSRGLNCRSATQAFVEVELQRKKQGDVEGNPGAAQCEGCRHISLRFSVTCLSSRQSNDVTNDRIEKYSWSLWLCWVQSGDPHSEGFERSVGCDVLWKQDYSQLSVAGSWSHSLCCCRFQEKLFC